MEVRLVQEHASLPTTSQLKGGSPSRLGASRLSTNASLELSTLTIIQREQYGSSFGTRARFIARH